MKKKKDASAELNKLLENKSYCAAQICMAQAALSFINSDKRIWAVFESYLKTTGQEEAFVLAVDVVTTVHLEREKAMNEEAI